MFGGGYLPRTVPNVPPTAPPLITSNVFPVVGEKPAIVSMSSVPASVEPPVAVNCPYVLAADVPSICGVNVACELWV